MLERARQTPRSTEIAVFFFDGINLELETEAAEEEEISGGGGGQPAGQRLAQPCVCLSAGAGAAAAAAGREVASLLLASFVSAADTHE